MQLDYNNKDLIFSDIPEDSVKWSAPSNIALVKYWGKFPIQIPANPSISFTLSSSKTETEMSFAPKKGNKSQIDFYLEKELNLKFGEKIGAFFEQIAPIFPFLAQLDFEIYSHNTFPHSAGIASSASGMAALALCICEIENKYFNSFSNEEEFYKKASYVARIGSGSACRSLYGGLVNWGNSVAVEGSSDEFGTMLKTPIHPDFYTYQDKILIVDAGQKKVSSRVGHGLMNTNPFAQQRFQQARENMQIIVKAMQENDQATFIKTVESEALTLHAMMMCSDPYFLLMKPRTLEIIEKLFNFREKTGLDVCFTLDAGPNIHLLYPKRIENEVNEFIEKEVKANWPEFYAIQDEVGKGPMKMHTETKKVVNS